MNTARLVFMTIIIVPGMLFKAMFDCPLFAGKHDILKIALQAAAIVKILTRC